ncbi:MAG: SMP-30/gluconolaconase/LRE domain-containing protein [Candidatus Aramenus sulfurataquae]|jgi:sugar lactone lactonase YvrE|uniref:SMP-30/gluconolaconase/LRE domain-containing protein n=3 Tax=Candidatus Aramenus sulfurataquae TaxID=1326980 RepID=W7KYR4_9CREN|nr:MAG: SMP-30/gluconolaconase/LRE domain-containing protein [Candidatus Aramenus sulfurataquae]
MKVNIMDKYSEESGELFESPLWHKGLLYWVDILKGVIYRRGKVEEKLSLGNYVSSIQPHVSHELVATSGRGFYLVDFNSGARLGYEVKEWDSRNRFNDGKCDALGRYWAGTMNLEEKYPTGGLYVLDLNGSYREVISGTTISNGMAWSLDNKLFYFIDTPTRKVFSFEFDLEGGRLGKKKVAFDFNSTRLSGNPDGMTIDSEGKLWVALFGEGKVVRVDPESHELLETIEVPTLNATSVAFGGENLDTLFVTTASIHLKERDKNAGFVYYEKTSYRGLESFLCRVPT